MRYCVVANHVMTKPLTFCQAGDKVSAAQAFLNRSGITCLATFTRPVLRRVCLTWQTNRVLPRSTD